MEFAGSVFIWAISRVDLEITIFTLGASFT